MSELYSDSRCKKQKLQNSEKLSFSHVARNLEEAAQRSYHCSMMESGLQTLSLFKPSHLCLCLSSCGYKVSDPCSCFREEERKQQWKIRVCQPKSTPLRIFSLNAISNKFHLHLTK